MESADKLMVDVLYSGTAWKSGTAVLAGSVTIQTVLSQGVGVACGDGERVMGDDAAGLEASVTGRVHWVETRQY